MHRIAILGRPNVGKSTLFNRLTRTRRALVADVPGVTRDRQYGVVDDVYSLIDTGGIVDDEQDVDAHYYDVNYTSRILAQAKQAAMEADIILVVVDAHSGMVALDMHVVNLVRRFDRELLLVVNKIDGASDWSEFYQFGIPVHPIAAQSRRGIKKLHQTLCHVCERVSHATTKTTTHSPVAQVDTQPKIASATQLPSTEQDDQQPIRCLLLGKPNVGKSTLTNRMLGFDRMITCDMSGTTLDVVETPLIKRGKAYTLIDTAGLRRRKQVQEYVEKFSQRKTQDALAQSHVALLLIDGKGSVSEQDMRLLRMVFDAGKAIVLVVNKWDGMTQDAKAEFVRGLEHKMRRQVFFDIEYISALHGTGVGTLFGTISRAYVAHQTWCDKRELQELLFGLLERNPPARSGSRTIKVKYVRQTNNQPPTITLFGNPLLKNMDESYVRYLASAIRNHFALFGSSICIQLQWQENPYQSAKSAVDRIQKKLFYC